METIIVRVEWCEKNFGATFSENVPGAVVFTASRVQDLKRIAKETLDFHIKGMIEDGDKVPQWLLNGDYQFQFVFCDVASLLQSCSDMVPLVSISRATGINPHQLSHYANGIKKPRPAQRQRIIEGLHKIGRELLTVE